MRDLLLRLLEEERPSEYRELLHARIAECLDAAGRGAEAVEHWLEVPDDAAAAVAHNGDALLNTAPATAARWLARIGGPERLAPELRLLEGRLAIGTGRLLDAEAPLRDAMLGFEARGDESQAWSARLSLADALTIQERFETAIPLAAGFERSWAPAAPMVAVTVAAALAGVCEFDAAVELFERAVADERGAPFFPFAQGFRGFWVDLQCGELDAALRRVRAAVAELERHDPFSRLAYLLGMEAVILEERGEDAAALETFARARRLAHRTVLGGYIEDIGVASPRRARPGGPDRRGRTRRAPRAGRTSPAGTASGRRRRRAATTARSRPRRRRRAGPRWRRRSRQPNFPPACSLVKITSTPGSPVRGSLSTGMPRPSSYTSAESSG